MHLPEDDRQPEEPNAPQGSVLGSLPRERPGTRSARRGATPGAETPGRGPASVGDEAAAEGRGVEELAWAGIAVAAEAATLGVRLANRAIEAMRDATRSS